MARIDIIPVIYEVTLIEYYESGFSAYKKTDRIKYIKLDIIYLITTP